MVGQDREEFLAAEAADRSTRHRWVALRRLEVSRDGDQHGVAGIVATVVVDCLEMVDVDQRNHDFYATVRDVIVPGLERRGLRAGW